MKTIVFNNLTDQYQHLLQEAATAMEKAYNPYSHFYVGAALLTTNNTVIGGCNIENAAYNPTICAERSAFALAMTQGYRTFTAISLIGRGKDFESTEVISPCGICRQVLFEASQISNVDIDVIMSNTKMTKIIIATISELLPLAFGPKDLGIDVTTFLHDGTLKPGKN